MAEDLTSKLIGLQTKTGIAFLCQRSMTGGSITESWEESYKGVTVKIPAAYISRESFEDFRTNYSTYSGSVANRKDKAHLNNLKRLILNARNPSYEGESGIVVRIVEKPDGYHIKAFEVEKQEEPGASSKPSNKAIDFEEIVAGIVDTPSTAQKPYAPKSAGKSVTAKPASPTGQNPADRYKHVVTNPTAAKPADKIIPQKPKK